jgi:biopolymer transport protein ExbD
MIISSNQLLLLTMYKLLPFLVFFFLFSCEQDCSKCENTLDYVMSNQQARVDVPEPKIEDSVAAEVFMKVKVTADDKYTIDGEEYTIDEITAMIDERLSSETISSRKIKIEGEKMAHYDPIFKLMALAQINGLEPVLAYTK